MTSLRLEDARVAQIPIKTKLGVTFCNCSKSVVLYFKKILQHSKECKVSLLLVPTVNSLWIPKSWMFQCQNKFHNCLKYLTNVTLWMVESLITSSGTGSAVIMIVVVIAMPRIHGSAGQTHRSNRVGLEWDRHSGIQRSDGSATSHLLAGIRQIQEWIVDGRFPEHHSVVIHDVAICSVMPWQHAVAVATSRKFTTDSDGASSLSDATVAVVDSTTSSGNWQTLFLEF